MTDRKTNYPGTWLDRPSPEPEQMTEQERQDVAWLDQIFGVGKVRQLELFITETSTWST